MFKKTIGIVVAVGAVCAVHADFIGMDYQGVGVVGVVKITDGGSPIPDGHYYAGTLRFNEHENPASQSLGNNILTLCADMYDDFSGPPAYWYDQVFVASTYHPSGKHYYDTNSLGLAANIATAGLSIGNSLTSDQAVGLQVAVWAALYNKADVSVANLGFLPAGDLHVGIFDISELTAGAQSAAESFWDGRFNTTPGVDALFIEATGGTGPGFYHGQDMLTLRPHGYTPTPEPFTMTLGLAAAGLFIRRRTKKSA